MYRFQLAGAAVECETADELRAALNGHASSIKPESPAEYLSNVARIAGEIATAARKAPVKKHPAGTVNKSQSVRDYAASNPTATPKEIATALSAKRLYVSAQFVSTVLSQAKRKAKAK